MRCCKRALKGKFIVIDAYKKLEISQRNTLILHLKEPEKEEQTRPKVNKRKITKIGLDIK